jgi:hypothetical protein
MGELSEDRETGVSGLQDAVTGVAVIDGKQNELLFVERRESWSMGKSM